MNVLHSFGFCRYLFVGIALLITSIRPAEAAADEAVNSRLGTLELDHGLPTAATRQKLYDELDFQRAVQAVIWAEPAINNLLFRKAMARAGVPSLGAMVYDQADYRISFLSPDYQPAVITREKRDYVWILARTPTISGAELARLAEFVESRGYELSRRN